MNKQEKTDGMEWKPIPGYEGYYASSDGRIASAWIPTRIGRKLVSPPKPMCVVINSYGYPTINMKPPGQKRQIIPVHKLIALAFYGEREPGQQVCHNNGIKTDNRVENLRYDSALANNRDKVRHGTSTPGSKNNTAKLHESDVFSIRMADLLCGDELSCAKLARQYKVSVSTISLIRLGKTWKHVRVYGI